MNAIYLLSLLSMVLLSRVHFPNFKLLVVNRKTNSNAHGILREVETPEGGAMRDREIDHNTTFVTVCCFNCSILSLVIVFNLSLSPMCNFKLIVDMYRL